MWQSLLELFSFSPGNPLLFHTGFFFFFLCIFLIGYSFVADNPRARNMYIMLLSFYFYYKTSGWFLGLLLFTISSDYVVSHFIERSTNQRHRKMALTGGILLSLSFLFYFKYSNFFVGNFNALTGSDFLIRNIILPIGISFYTFQSISYLVDVYQRKISVPPFRDYLMYMSFFPHLVAGPIVRASDFLPQVAKGITISRETRNEAFYLIIKGLIKKAIISDYIAQYADTVFSQPGAFSGTENSFATLCYTFQIFFDFSGYTDIAIGVALLMGFRLGINFRSPYKSFNITDFWRRWHISLSQWLRDYIYIPLGGNAKGFPMQLGLLVTTMLIGGFWHGADWKFVFWGLGHGVLLVLHKIFVKLVPGEMKWFRPPGWLLTFCCVALLWVPFRATSWADAVEVYKGIFSGVDVAMLKAIAQNNPLLMMLFVTGAFLSLMPQQIKEAVRTYFDGTRFAVKIAMLVIVIQLMLQMRVQDVHPFIYFEF
jgi:D-alanyl-lipoteichoic acid acyltransferase DltB (MBOAT superfamily)